METGEVFQPGGDSDHNTLLRILRRTASLVQCRACGVFNWDRDRSVLVPVRPFHGIDDQSLTDLEIGVNASQIGAVALQDRPVDLDVARADESSRALLASVQADNAFAYPVAIERRDDSGRLLDRNVMGVLIAFDKHYGHAFDTEDSKILGLMARQITAILVTSRLYWEEKVRRERLKGILESTSVGIMAVSPKGAVTQINAAGRRALNVADTGWFGHHFREVIHQGEVNALIDNAMIGEIQKEPREITLPVETLDSEADERIYRVQADPIIAEDGSSMGHVIVFENITDIRTAERMMAAFVDMVSHELRTPLTPIRGFVSTLLQGGEGVFDWDTQAEFLQIVDTEAERLGVLIDDFLNIARIQNGRQLQFNYTPVSLATVVEHICRLHRQSSYMKSNHDLVIDIPQDVPEIRADESMLQQILHNLVGNALKYSPQGGEVRISARERTENGIPGVVLGVKDQGLGIPPDAVSKMFGQFYRVESSAHQGIKGTGLGLWLTRHMVDGHKGRIWVESEFGHGAEFFVWFPLDPAAIDRDSDL